MILQRKQMTTTIFGRFRNVQSCFLPSTTGYYILQQGCFISYMDIFEEDISSPLGDSVVNYL